MKDLSRRQLLGASAAGVATWAIGRSARAALDRPVRHAVIGTGGQGQGHVKTFAQTKNCSIAAVCDLDPERRDKVAGVLAGKFDAKITDDFYEVIGDPDIDSVSIATPDHWHTPIALHALKAGKHVYVEKPCSHNILEAYALEKAAAASGRCVQHGTQHRSGTGPQAAVKFMREGGLGKVRMAKAINHQHRGKIGRAEVEAPPAGVNYDRWLGPAPEHDFTKNRWHYQWHWFWDYGCGDIGNDGIHQIDMMRWGMGVGYPNKVMASGGQFYYEDDHQTPDTQTVVYEYDDCHLMYEMRLWTRYKLEGHDNGVIFYGDKGKLEVGRNGCELSLVGEEKKKIGGPNDFTANVRNFIECVHAGTPEMLNAPIDEGVCSTALCHLGNIGTRVGRSLQLSGDGREIREDLDASALLGRTYRKGYELPHV
jgi:predicted dehydrogenase